MRKKWSVSIRDSRDFIRDFWSDFRTTIFEVAGESTLAQILAVAMISCFYIFFLVLVWALVSFALCLLVWVLWNYLAPDLGLPQLTYWKSYCLTLLSLLLIRGNSVHLRDGK